MKNMYCSPSMMNTILISKPNYAGAGDGGASVLISNTQMGYCSMTADN